MAINDSKKQVLNRIKTRSYLNKDFDSFRADLLVYKRVFFPDTPTDDSDASFGGLLMDMPSYIGDVLSFYSDHQFFELDPLLAIEPRNIQRHLERSNVPIVGASPAVVDQTFTFEIPVNPNDPTLPYSIAMPKLFSGTTVTSNSGIQFQLTDDLDFSETDSTGKFKASYEVGKRDAQNNPSTYFVSRNMSCISGLIGSETFQIGSFKQFKQFTLSQPNVSSIQRIVDNLGNEYYEVEYLTQDTVYKALPNLNYDRDLVKENFIPTPAPYRFIKRMNVNTKITTITFGGGSSESANDDILPDPSQFSVPLYGKRVISRFTINPNNMLLTTTLGTIIPNTTLTVQYRYGGGLSHNVPSNSIRGVSSIQIGFPNSPSVQTAQFVRNSISTNNSSYSSGGEDAPSIEQLRTRIPQFANAQGRIVSKPDLIARIYTMPSDFGRVFRAAIHSNPNNPLASQLYIISRDQNSKFIISPDTLKKNLSKYINDYRLISDAVDILDARVINLKISFSIVVDPNLNKNSVLASVITSVKTYFSNRIFQIDQPLIRSDLNNLIYNSIGVISVPDINIQCLTGITNSTASGPGDDRLYSDVQIDINSSTNKGILFPPIGGIFEIRYMDFDIVGMIV